jgi:hypothetical protein
MISPTGPAIPPGTSPWPWDLSPAGTRTCRYLLFVVVAVVALGRMYVGAHLPLDGFGGVLLGGLDGEVVRALSPPPCDLCPCDGPHLAHCRCDAGGGNDMTDMRSVAVVVSRPRLWVAPCTRTR